MSEDIEYWEQRIAEWSSKKWHLLRKFLTPEQLEQVRHADGVLQRYRYGLKRELEDNPVAEGWPVIGILDARFNRISKSVDLPEEDKNAD